MLYGAGAAFDFASLAYTRLRDTGMLLFSELPIFNTSWDNKHQVLTVRLSGDPRFSCKLELRSDPASKALWKLNAVAVEAAPSDKPREFHLLQT